MNSDNHSQNQPLLAALFKGRSIIEKMEKRWPDDFEAIKRSEPLWKTDLAFISQGWADFAAQSLGWLDQSASSLVSSSKVLADRPLSQYNEIATRLDKLHEEVARAPSEKSLLDNWHILRRPVQQTPAERLEKIIEDKKALDQASGSRLRGLRDAIEMRDFSRELLALLHQNFKSLEDAGVEKVEASRRDIENAFGSDVMTPMAQQQNERIDRLDRRAKSALAVIQERITHEFSGNVSGVSDLDEAINQETLMHSRIESMTGKVASLIAGRDLGQVSKEQSMHMQLISTLPEVAQEKSISISPKSGFLGRLLHRQDKSGMSKESKKVLTELRRVFEEPGYALTLSEIREKHSQEYFWKLISELMKDPEVSALEPIKGSPLLCFMVGGLNQIKKDEAPELFTKALCITYMMAENGKDSKKALKKARPSLLRSILKKSLALEECNTQSASHQQEVFWGLSLISRALDHECDNADITRLLAQFIQENPTSLLPKHTLDVLVSVCGDLLLPGKKVSNWNSHLGLVDTLSKHLPFETVSYQYFHYFEQRMFSNDSRQLSRHAVETLLFTEERMAFLSMSKLDQLAEAVLRQRENRVENWGSVLLTRSREMLAKSEGSATLDQFENLNILNEYFSMMQSQHPLGAWPKEMTRVAFAKKDIDLLNDLAKYQPNAQIPELAGQGYDKMLMTVISSDFQASVRNNGAPQTDPLFWIQRLSSTGKDNGPVIPQKTPLMVAFASGSAHWVKALLNAGADLNAVDQHGMSAHDHWFENLWTSCELSAQEHSKGKSRGAPTRTVVNHEKALALFTQRAYEQFEAFDQWPYFEKLAATRIPPGRMLAHAIEQELISAPERPENKERAAALARSIKNHGHDFFFDTLKNVLLKTDLEKTSSKMMDKIVKMAGDAELFDPQDKGIGAKILDQLQKEQLKLEKEILKEKEIRDEIDIKYKKMLAEKIMATKDLEKYMSKLTHNTVKNKFRNRF